MLVSLLQMMGFPAAKPLHSPAKEKAMAREAKPEASALQEQPVRRSIVKTPVSKSKKVVAKPTQSSMKSNAEKSTKPNQSVKSVKTVKPEVVAVSVKSKPVSGKAVTKVSVKPKIPVKPLAKSTAKPSAKKVPVQAVVKKIIQTGIKPDGAGKTSSTSARPVVTPLPTISKKKSESVTRVVEPKAPAAKTAKTGKNNLAATPTSPIKPTVAEESSAKLTSLGIPVRSGRPSSRLAQLTVPSMAQSVASTAAKASFTQLTALQPIVSPLASAVKKDPKLANNWKKKTVDQLSDEEIIAMSDQEYMNDTQMAYFRLKLVTLKNEVLSNAGETTEHLREDTVVVPDPADRATIEEEHALELRTRDRERKLLKKIEQSINRIDAGDYGYCDETGEPIGVARLLARPTATLSLEAQQRRELKQKMFGD